MGGKAVRPKLEKVADSIIGLYASGMSINNVAKTFQCSPTPIRHLLIDHGVQLRLPIRPRKLEAHREAIEALYRAGHNTKFLANRFSVSVTTVSEFLDSIGIRRDAPLSERTFHIAGEANKGVLAGLLVGEGSIITTGKGIRITIVNQDKGVIDWMAQWGGYVCWSKPRPPRSPNSCGIWGLSAAIDVFHCLVTLLPYMVGSKAKLAGMAIERLKSNYGLAEIP